MRIQVTCVNDENRQLGICLNAVPTADDQQINVNNMAPVCIRMSNPNVVSPLCL
jgi:hypothetical protein